MSKIINWVRSGDSPPETYFLSTYSSDDQEQIVKFFLPKEYREMIIDGPWVAFLTEKWNYGDCGLSELRWLPEISTAKPMWADVAQNHSPDGQNYVALSQHIEQIIRNIYADILSGKTRQFTFFIEGDQTNDNQEYIFTTGVVKP